MAFNKALSAPLPHGAVLIDLPVPGIIKKVLDALKEKGEEKTKEKDVI